MTDDLMDLADSLTQSPARQDGSQTPAAAVAGGPVQTTQRELGEELTPSSAVVVAPAARTSTGVVAGAGADVPAWDGSEGGRAWDPLVPGAVSEFTLPGTRVPLRFGEGEHRLVGAVRLGDGPPRPGHPGPPKPTPFPPPPTT